MFLTYKEFFFVIGFISVDHRTFTASTTSNMLAPTNIEFGYKKYKRQQNSSAACKRFTSINIALELVPRDAQEDCEREDELETE